MNNYLLKLMMGMSVLTCPLLADAPAAPAQPQSEDEQCAREILMHHFPEKFVKETLKKFQVPEDQQEAIVKELSEKEKNIVKMVEEKAASMNPNPLKDPQMRQQAVKMFRETLLEQFGSVLKAHGVTDDDKIQQMLDDVQLQKAKQFTECMERMHPEIKQKKPAPGQAAPTDSDSDDDGDDDSDQDD